MANFIVDSVAYDMGVTAGSLRRIATVKDGVAAGTMKDGSYTRDIIGTLIDYSMTIERHSAQDDEYDALWLVLTDPDTPVHTVTFPYGQSTLTFAAYIQTVEDSLNYTINGYNGWGSMSVTFKAQTPQRVPSGV